MCRKWTKADIEYLTNNYCNLPVIEVADFLGRTKKSAHLKANKIGLSKIKSWSKSDLDFLKASVNTVPVEKIATKFGVSVASVRAQYTKLGICTNRIKKVAIREISDKEVISFCKHHGETVHRRSVGNRLVCKECAHDYFVKNTKKLDYVVNYAHVKSFFEREGYKLLSKEYKGAKHLLRFECNKGHFGKISWNSFQQGSRCKECSYENRNGTKLQIEYVREYIGFVGYKLLSKEYINNSSRLTVCCDVGHEYETTFNWFKDCNSRCRVCKYIKHAEEQRLPLDVIVHGFAKEGFALRDQNLKYVNNRQKLPVLCPVGHEIDVSWHSFSSDGTRCKECSGNGTSFAEKQVSRFISSVYSGEVINNSRSIISPLEVDIYLPEKKLAIEYNGLYWHSHKEDKRADFKKFLALKEKGIRYIGIFEDEWVKRREFLEKYLINILGVSKPKFILRPQKIFIEKVSYNDVKQLLNEHHYSGARAAKYYFGLVYQEKLIGCILIAKPTRQHVKAEWEIVRMCMDPAYRVHGLWSYISKHILDIFFRGEKIVSFSDNRRNSGDVYRHMGFIEDGYTPSDYYWCKGIDRFHKSGLRKTEEEKKTGKTETVLREAQGYTKIYDVGKTRWVYFKE